MGEIRIRDMDEAVILEFKERARRHGTSLSEELRQFLTEEARRPRRDWSQRLAAQRAGIERQQGQLPDSSLLIREARDNE